MDYLSSIIAGIVQGLTEFLPISSSGHLIVLHDILKFNFFDNAFYDLALHFGTMIALVVCFKAEVVRIICAFFRSLRRWDLKNDEDERLAWFMILGLIPAVAFGLAFGSFIENALRHPAIVAGALVAVAGLFFVAEKSAVQSKNLQAMRASDAAVIGFAQALAFIPGVSRSGITLVAGLARKLKRVEAARFSFLLSVPTILGADLEKGLRVDWTQANWPVMIVGCLFAFASGLLAIRGFLKFVGHHPLYVFAWYRIALGLLIVVWLALFR